MSQKFANYCLDVLREIKLFHWLTVNYDFHLITDNLYRDLSTEIDAIVEAVLSARSKVPPRPPAVKKGNLLGTLSNFEKYLSRMKCARARANIDNALQILGKFSYLCKMVNK